jgi:serine/threonine protein kinase
LLNYILKYQYLEEYEASRIFKYIIETIAYIHNAGIKPLKKGIVHRDLKPENILIAMDKT